MEKTIYEIALDLQKGCAGGTMVVKKGDTHRRLRLRLLSGGRPYPLAEDCYAVFTAQKPDGTVIYNPCVRDGSNLVYDLTPQTTAAVGVLDCEIKIYGEKDALLTSAAFTVTVEDTVYSQGEEAVTSTGEASALTRLITQAREAISDVEAEMEKIIKNEANHAVIDDTKAGDDAWSAKNTVDRLCPGFTESGSAVTCEPVEGYPLEAISTIDNNGSVRSGIKLYNCGKNLLNEEALAVHSGYYLDGNGDLSLNKARWICFATDTRIRPNTTYTISSNLTVYSIWFRQAGVGNLSKLSVNNRTPFTFTTPENCDCLRITLNNTSGAADTVAFEWAQLELGNAATAHEQYHGEVYTADLAQYGVTEGQYNWKTGVLTDGEGNETQTTPNAVIAHAGVNTLCSDCGDTSVSGKADPAAVIGKLTNAIVALGGNV